MPQTSSDECHIWNPITGLYDNSPESFSAHDVVLEIQIDRAGAGRMSFSPQASPADRIDLLAHLQMWLTQQITDPGCNEEMPNQHLAQVLSSTPASLPLIQICCGETDRWAVWFSEAFRGLQQLACRFIAKEWIKAIHPRKQSSHPYRSARSGKSSKPTESSVPGYWPCDVEHKEPDHIDKDSRIRLLTHLLLGTPHVELNSGSRTPRQYGATDLLNVLIGSHIHLREKWPILEEIIMARTILEKLENGLLDANHIVTVHHYGAKLKSPDRADAIGSSANYAERSLGLVDANPSSQLASDVHNTHGRIDTTLQDQTPPKLGEAADPMSLCYDLGDISDCRNTIQDIRPPILSQNPLSTAQTMNCDPLAETTPLGNFSEGVHFGLPSMHGAESRLSWIADEDSGTIYMSDDVDR